MGILSLQKQVGQIGRIRLGHTVAGTTKGGKHYTRPAKLESFRFTTHSEFAAHAVADLLGGEPRRWTRQAGAPREGMWEVFTERDQVNVTVPPGPRAVDSWYELWQPGMCVRRCDGETEQLSGEACLCPADQDVRARLAGKGEACRMTTRINVMIPDLPGIGLWMLESHGFYAATEMTGVAELLAGVGQSGVMIPALLRIEQRERRIYRGRDQESETRKFPVPVLEVLATMREIAGAAASGQRALALPPPVAPVKAAIGAGPAPAAAEAPAAAAPAPTDQESIAQALADRALCATDDQELRAIWEEARPVLDEWVSVPHYEELISLSDVIKERKHDFDTRRTA
jgi:hypothetical protein